MDALYHFQLNLYSLLVFSLLPFFSFAVHKRFRYSNQAIKRGDFFLGIIAVVLAGFVLLKLTRPPENAAATFYLLAVLHILPLAQLLLYVSDAQLRPARVGRTGPKGATAGHDSYAPRPVGKEVGPSSWDEIIIHEDLKTELQSVVKLLEAPKAAQQYGIEVPKGILLSGPPGTGKTSIARVIASTAKLSFFVLKMDEIVSKWVGESEKNLSLLFQAAQRHAPSVVFIDEVDAIGRSRTGSEQRWAENLLNHLLQTIDGIVKSEGIYIIAATNRAELVDPALKRAGRLTKVIEVPLPGKEARMNLFHLYLSKLKVSDAIDFEILAQVTEGCSGADIKEICNQAGLNAFKRESGTRKKDYTVSATDIQHAVNEFAAM